MKPFFSDLLLLFLLLPRCETLNADTPRTFFAGLGVVVGGTVGFETGTASASDDGAEHFSQAISVSKTSLSSKPPVPKEWRITSPPLAEGSSQSIANSTLDKSWPSQLVSSTHVPASERFTDTQPTGPNVEVDATLRRLLACTLVVATAETARA
jgi:hypothetical protein